MAFDSMIGHDHAGRIFGAALGHMAGDAFRRPRMFARGNQGIDRFDAALFDGVALASPDRR